MYHKFSTIWVTGNSKYVYILEEGWREVWDKISNFFPTPILRLMLRLRLCKNVELLSCIISVPRLTTCKVHSAVIPQVSSIFLMCKTMLVSLIFKLQPSGTSVSKEIWFRMSWIYKASWMQCNHYNVHLLIKLNYRIVKKRIAVAILSGCNAMAIYIHTLPITSSLDL